jgi:hypothetical protein
VGRAAELVRDYAHAAATKPLASNDRELSGRVRGLVEAELEIGRDIKRNAAGNGGSPTLAADTAARLTAFGLDRSALLDHRVHDSLRDVHHRFADSGAATIELAARDPLAPVVDLEQGRHTAVVDML